MKLDLDNIFTYHAPKPGQPERYETIRKLVKDIARLIIRNCPESRERDIAIMKLEEAVMWANSSIARNE